MLSDALSKILYIILSIKNFSDITLPLSAKLSPIPSQGDFIVNNSVDNFLR